MTGVLFEDANTELIQSGAGGRSSRSLPPAWRPGPSRLGREDTGGAGSTFAMRRPRRPAVRTGGWGTAGTPPDGRPSF